MANLGDDQQNRRGLPSRLFALNAAIPNSLGLSWTAPDTTRGQRSNGPTLKDLKPNLPSATSPHPDVKAEIILQQTVHGVDFAALLDQLRDAKQAWEALKGGGDSAGQVEALQKAQAELHQASRAYKSTKEVWTGVMEREALQEYRAQKHHWKDYNMVTPLQFHDGYKIFFAHEMQQPRPWSLFQHEKFEWKHKKWLVEAEDRAALAKEGVMLERKRRLEEAQVARRAAAAMKIEAVQADAMPVDAMQAEAAPQTAREAREQLEATVQRAEAEAEATQQTAREARDQRAEALAARREATPLGRDNRQFVERRGSSPPILAAARSRVRLPARAKAKPKPKPQKKKKPSAAELVMKERAAVARRAKRESKVKAETAVKTESVAQREATAKKEVHVKRESEARVKSERL